jgi:hypothetical protein
VTGISMYELTEEDKINIMVSQSLDFIDTMMKVYEFEKVIKI